MSDLYGDLSSAVGQARSNKSNLYGDVQGAVEEARAVTSFQGIPVQTWEYDLISKWMADAPDIELAGADIGSAIQLSRYYQQPLSEVYQNLEAYRVSFLGDGYTPKTAPKAIADSVAIGWYTQRMNDLGNLIAGSGGDSEELFKQYQAFKDLANGLADNVKNRSLFIEALKAGAQSAPYMLQSGAIGALAVGVGSLLAPATGGLSAIAAAALFKFGSGAGSALGVSGLEYMRMRENGVAHDAAISLAALSAGAQGALEVALGADAAIAGLLTKGELKTITGNVAKKLFIQGVWPTIAVRSAARLVGETFEEGVEEASQAVVAALADHAAAEIMESRGIEVNRDSLKTVMGEVLENAKMGALAAPVFGILSGPFQAKVDYQTLKGVKDFAKATDRETFKKEAAAAPAVQNIIEAIPEEQQAEALDKVWEQAQAEVKKEEAKAKAPTGKPVYLNGALYTAEDSLREREDGTVEAILKTGSPETGDRYGYLRYEVQPTANGERQILLKEANVKADYAQVAPELLLDLAARYPGISIVTNEGSTERAKSLVEKLTAGNPRGIEAGAQWFEGEGVTPDSKAKASLRAQIIENIPKASSGQVEVGVLLHELRANAMGLGLRDYMAQNFQDQVFSRDEAKLQEEWGKATAAAEVEGLGAKAGIAFDKEARAIIYVAKNANFKSFIHESAHAFRMQTVGTDLGKRINQAYGIVGDTWTREREETFTDDFLRWASYGEVKDEKVRGVFEQLGKWLVRLWNAISGREQVKPEIAALFNELFASEKSPLAAMAAQGQAEATQVESTEVEASAEAPTAQEATEIEEEEKPEVSVTTSMDTSEYPVREVPIAEITLSPDVPNFKEGANEKTGAVVPLKAKRYIRLGTAPIVVWERKSGAKEVITGRHRLDLARRLGETTIPAQIVREADGFTKEQAATFDAEANIRDGQGTVRDYANYFRNTDISYEEASSRGLLSRDAGRAGFAIGKYAKDGLYSLYRAGKIGEKKAAAIAEASKGDERLQEVGIKKARELTAEELFNYVSMLSATLSGGEVTQSDLFGNDESFMVEAEKIAKEATKVMEGLVNERRALEGAKKLGQADRATILEQYGVKAGDERAIQARLDQLAEEMQAWEGWTTDPAKMRELRIRIGLPVSEVVEPENPVSQDTEDTGPKLFEPDRDKASLKRSKRDFIVFSKPFVGKTGAKLVGYEWPNIKIEEVDNRGEEFIHKYSDWSQADISEMTGRKFVHKFIIEKTDGSSTTLSAESAAYALGVSEATARNTARKLLEQEVDRANKIDKSNKLIAELEAGPWYATPAEARLNGRFGGGDMLEKARTWGERARKYTAEYGGSRTDTYARESSWTFIKGPAGFKYESLNGYGLDGETLDSAAKERNWQEVNLNNNEIWDDQGNPIAHELPPAPPPRPVESKVESAPAPAKAKAGQLFLFMADNAFEESILNEAAVQAFGLTTLPDEAGYILSDGRMLDFSGKNQLGKGTTAQVTGGTRRLNHESIAQVAGVSPKTPSIDFMKKTGAVRVDFERGAAYSIGIPTFDAAAKVAAHAKGQFTLHIDGADGELVGRKTLQAASPVEIARFYSSPTKPETGSLFSDEELGPRVKNGQGLLFEGEGPALSSKQISELAQIAEYGLKGDYASLESEAVGILEKAGVDYLDGYHVIRSQDIEGIKIDGIKGSEWYGKPSGVYFLADPDDIGRGYPYLNMKMETGEEEVLPVIHFRIPKNDIKNIRWDGYFNVSFGTYSSFLHVGDIPPEQIVEIKQARFPSRATTSSEPTITLFEPETPWVYKSEVTLRAKLQGPQPGKAILKMLQSSGVKEDELHWTGLDEYLDTDEKRKPEEVLAFLEANKLKIEEKTGIEPLDNHVPKEYFTAKWGPNGPYKLTLPGGENYREVLFTLPVRLSAIEYEREKLVEIANAWPPAEGREQAIERLRELNNINPAGDNGNHYHSTHWPEPDVLAHTRLDDRIDAKGRRTLFVEEIQSDWHQNGRDQGYQKPLTPKEEQRKEELRALPWAERTMETNQELEPLLRRTQSGVPDAPFKKNWHEFVFKRVLREAVENDYEAVAWTTGEQQADRYNLAKQIDSMTIVRSEHGFHVAASKDGERSFETTAEDTHELSNLIGKELAEKAEAIEVGGYKTFDGVDLKVGGEGMRNFYDRDIVNYANKLGKKWGAQVEDSIVTNSKYTIRRKNNGMWEAREPNGNFINLENEAEAREYIKDGFTVHSLPITDAMRDSVKTEGLMLFEKEESTPEEKAAFNSAVKIFGLTSSIYEAGYVLPDGRMLDFSGRHEASGYKKKNGRFIPERDDYLANSRNYDHRQIDWEGADKDKSIDWTSPSTKMYAFMRKGAIRVDANSGLADMTRMPTEKQWSVVKDIIQSSGSTWVEMKDGDRRATIEAEGNASKALGYIRRFYSGEDFDETILFEPIEEVATQVQDELYVRDLDYSVRFSRSSLSRYYSFALGDRLYTVRVSDHPRPPQAARWGYADFNVNTQNPDDLEAFREWISELTGEKKYEGRMLFQPTDPTESQAFREWFGDSEVVDENGNPLVMYHGTRVELEQFDNAQLGKATGAASAQLGYFFTAESIAKTFGTQLYPVYLKIENPYHIRADEFQELLFGQDEKQATLDSSLEDLGNHIDSTVLLTWDGPATYDEAIDRESLDDEGKILYDKIIEIMNRDDRDDSEYYGKNENYFKEWRKQLENDGYDGIIIDSQDYHSEWERAPELDSDNYIVFSPEQIKSVDNRGTWDATDPRILFEDEEPAPIEPPDPFSANRGKFTEKMSQPGELEGFLAKLWERMKSDYDPAVEGDEKKPRPKSEVEKRLSSHPFVLGAAITIGKNKQTLAPSVRRAVLGTVRKNELAFKELAAEVMGDIDLAQEARAEKESIVGPAEIKNPRLRKYDEMTLAERTAILNRIRDDTIKAKIESEGITDRDIAEYIGRLEADRAKLAEKEKALEHGKEANEGLWEALRSARQESRLQTKMVAAEIRAMYRIKEARKRLIDNILEPPTKRMRYEEKSKIRFIQEYLRTKKWEVERTEAGGYRKTGRIIEPAVLAMKFSQLFRETPELANLLSQNVVNKINSLPLSDWSVAELASLWGVIDALRTQGVMAFAQKEALRRKNDFEKRRFITNAFRAMKGYRDPLAGGSDEEREQIKKLDSKHIGAFLTMNMDRFARIYMDRGNPDLPNWNLLVDEERTHYRDKMGNVERRLGKVVAFAREKGIKPKDLYRKITVQGAGPRDSAATWSASDLMMMMLALRNEDSRKAVVYGNLFDEKERQEWPPASLKAMAAPRVNAVLRAIQTELTQDEKTLAEMIAADFDREFDRLNKAAIDLTEEDLQKVDNYIPIIRLGAVFESFSDELIVDLKVRNGIPTKAGPKRGFTKKRVRIGPNGQTQIKLDLWGTFMDAVDKQEHLISYGEYHKRLMSVYSEMHGSREIREAIKHRLGKQGIDYLDRYLAEVANPVAYKDRDHSERIVRILRGNMAVGYLAFRWSSVANQLITSPLPYLAYAPGSLFGASGQVLANPKKFIEEVEGMSIMLRNRQVDPVYTSFKHMNREGWEGVVKQIGEVGMKGLQWADRWTVAIGWKAVYDKVISQGLEHEEAVKQADDITLRCQPSARGVDLSPLFRDNNEWKRIVTQFGTQLNVVWQQFAFDMPQALKEKRFGEAVGILTAMGLAGIGLGALRKLRGKDEDEDDTWWNDWLFYALSQSTDSVPLIGSLVTDELKHLVTGKKPYRDSDTFPVVGGILSGVEGLSEGKGKGIKELAEAIGLTMGLPTQAVEDYLGWLLTKLTEE